MVECLSNFYLMYIKFGMGRATSGTEQEIRAGVIDRNEEISLIKKFDGEFPKKYFQDILDPNPHNSFIIHSTFGFSIGLFLYISAPLFEASNIISLL